MRKCAQCKTEFLTHGGIMFCSDTCREKYHNEGLIKSKKKNRPKTKKCTKCGETKPTTDFYFHNKKTGEVSSICKLCDNEKKKLWILNSPSKAKAQRQRYFEKNHEKALARIKEYKKLHPEKKRQWDRKRRAIKSNINENFTAADEHITIDTFSNTCFNCGDKFEHLDHNLPLSKGYPLALWNAVCLCAKCNTTKNDTDPVEFYGLDKASELFDILFTLEAGPSK